MFCFNLNTEHKKPYEKKTFVPTIVCKYYLQGTCRQDGSCTFLHEGEVVPPPTSQTVCHYYKTGSCTQGEDCKFSHVSSFFIETMKQGQLTKFIILGSAN